MKIALVTRIFAIALLLFAAAVFEAEAQTVTGSIGKGTVERGKAARGTIVLSIPDGLHVNSNRPASEYAIPTSVRLSARGVKIVGPTYPRGKNRKFQFSDNAINVYEDRVTFPFTLNVPANFRGNFVRVNATVRYQACTDEVCYPPRNRQVTLTARVM